MSLLRLTTTNDKCEFDSTFNEDIVLNSNSQMALQNLSMEVLVNTITIGNSNRTLNYKVTDTIGTQNILLDLFTYTNTNWDDLIKDMELKLNQSLLSVGKQIGLQYKISNVDKKIRVEYKITSYAWEPTDWTKTGLINTTGSGIIDQNNARADLTMEQPYKYYIAKPFVKGSGVFRTRIHRFVDNGLGMASDNGFIMGLSNVSPETWKADTYLMNNDEMTFAISAYKPTSEYEINYDGTGFDVSSVTPQNVASQSADNDILEINLSEGFINGVIHQSAGTTIVFSAPYDGESDLYPFILLGGNLADIRLEQIRQCLDPFNPESANTELDHTHILTALPTPQPPGAIDSNNLFNFGSLELANFLGFSKQLWEQSSVNFVIESDQEFTPTAYSDSFVVELLNIDLDSFDSQTNGRRNILAVVPQSDNNATHTVIYEPNTPFFINLKNANPNLLRNIRARVLNNQLETIDVVGITTLTLLVK